MVFKYMLELIVYYSMDLGIQMLLFYHCFCIHLFICLSIIYNIYLSAFVMNHIRISYRFHVISLLSDLVSLCVFAYLGSTAYLEVCTFGKTIAPNFEQFKDDWILFDMFLT